MNSEQPSTNDSPPPEDKPPENQPPQKDRQEYKKKWYQEHKERLRRKMNPRGRKAGRPPPSELSEEAWEEGRKKKVSEDARKAALERRRKNKEELKGLCKAKTFDALLRRITGAIDTLHEIATSKKAENKDRVYAAKCLLDQLDFFGAKMVPTPPTAPTHQPSGLTGAQLQAFLEECKTIEMKERSVTLITDREQLPPVEPPNPSPAPPEDKKDTDPAHP